jgi:hypothetical protein
MNIRGLLQTEIWSKRTSWKICLGFAGLAVLGISGWYAAERFWIRQSILSESRAVLTRIDQLQDSYLLNDEDFDAKVKLAEKEIDVAEKKAWTDREIGVTFQLSRYLHFLQLERMQARKDKGLGLSQTRRDKMHSSEAQLRQELHKELD